MPAFTPLTVYDFIRDISDGMDSGQNPLRLPRTKASLLRNATVRGTFVTHRPPYTQISLGFGGDPILQAAVQNNLFQGACYFKSYDGTESLVASIAGRLFRFVIVGQGATVTEATTASIRQLASASQCWLWQAERWVIVQDGFNLPLFYDAATLRRSNGSGTTNVGTLNGAQSTGDILGAGTLSLRGSYTGPFGATVAVGTGSAQKFRVDSQAVSVASTSAYSLTLKHLYGTTGSSGYLGAILKRASGYYGFLTAGATNSGGSITVPVSAPFTGVVGTMLYLHGFSGPYPNSRAKVTATSNGGLTLTLALLDEPFGVTIGAGAVLNTYPDSTLTWTNVATLANTFVDPAVGSSVTATIAAPFTGAIGDVILIDSRQYQITAYTVDPTVIYTATGVWMAGTKGTVNADNASLVLTTNELPAGRMGVNGLGRTWLALTDGRSFLGSDIVNGLSGTATYNYQDSVLSVTENLLLNGGGNFVVPAQAGDIRALVFQSVLDTSLGQGPLAVLTPNIVFSCQAPVDRTTWQNLTTPILSESLKANGGLSQSSTINVNGDLIFRSVDGLRSQILARREFQTWGNVPISREVQKFIQSDDATLLNFASAIEFDNRALYTGNPQQSALGVYHNELIAINFDPLSSLNGKLPSVYDGVWDGLNVLQLVSGLFAGVKRAFAFCLSADLSTIQLWEILPSSTANITDDGTQIGWSMESGSLNFFENDPRKREFLRLADGEMRLGMLNKTLADAAITGNQTVSVQTFYKFDQSGTWIPWKSWTETFDATTDPGWRLRGLGAPDPKPVDTVNNIPAMQGETMQFKMTITGHCNLLGARFGALTMAKPDFAIQVA